MMPWDGMLRRLHSSRRLPSPLLSSRHQRKMLIGLRSITNPGGFYYGNIEWCATCPHLPQLTVAPSHLAFCLALLLFLPLVGYCCGWSGGGTTPTAGWLYAGVASRQDVPPAATRLHHRHLLLLYGTACGSVWYRLLRYAVAVAAREKPERKKGKSERKPKPKGSQKGR